MQGVGINKWSELRNCEMIKILFFSLVENFWCPGGPPRSCKFCRWNQHFIFKKRRKQNGYSIGISRLNNKNMESQRNRRYLTLDSLIMQLYEFAIIIIIITNYILKLTCFWHTVLIQLYKPSDFYTNPH